MARYVARIHTDMSVEDTFAYMSDVRNFEEWDPGVVRSVQVEGDGPGVGSVYDVTVLNAGRESTLRYTMTEFSPPGRMKVIGKSRFLTSIDVIEVSTNGDKTEFVYDATLKLKFPLSLGDAFLTRVFNKIGDKAAIGMEKALAGALVS
jgi:hypothetical protein